MNLLMSILKQIFICRCRLGIEFREFSHKSNCEFLNWLSDSYKRYNNDFDEQFSSGWSGCVYTCVCVYVCI